MKNLFVLFKSPVITNILLILLLFSFSLIIYLDPDGIIAKFKKIKSEPLIKLEDNNYLTKDQKLQIKYAKEILKGGYILFYRHAERYKAEPYQQLQVYDAYEINNSIKAENTYFEKFVCLNDLGKIQAQMMGQIINDFNIKYSTVVSSSSCRARQTANIAFKKVDKSYNSLVHQGPWTETKKFFYDDVKKVILENIPKKNENTMMVAHNSVIGRHIFDKVFSENVEYFLQEGGFYLIEIKDGKLNLVYKFRSFNDFTAALYTRPKD